MPVHNHFYISWRRVRYIRRQYSASREKDINLFLHQYLIAVEPLGLQVDIRAEEYSIAVAVGVDDDHLEIAF